MKHIEPQPMPSSIAAPQATAAPRPPVIACIGTAVPVEVVLAAGCRCQHLRASADADAWNADCAPMESGHEVETRSLFRQLARGDHACTDLLVIAGTSDGYRYLFQYLRQMQRSGRGDAIPPLALFDLLFGPAPAVRRYSADALAGLVRRLEVLTARPITDDALRQAIARTNRLRDQARQVDALRAARRVSGEEAHAALRTATWDAQEDPADRLATRVREWSQRAALPGPSLLLVPSVPLVHERLHAHLEGAGCVVTAEDGDWGSRRATPDIATDLPPRQAILEHQLAHAVSPRMLQAQREAWLCEQIRSGRHQGVVFYLPPDDQFFGWRYPALRSLAEQHGLEVLLLRQEVLEADAESALRQAIEPFIARLAGPQEPRA